MVESPQDEHLLPSNLVLRKLSEGRVLRLARPEEYAEVRHVLQTAFTAGYSVTPHYYRYLGQVAERAEHAHVWVVSDEKGILAAFSTPHPHPESGESYTFNVLGVLPRSRGQNLGWALVDHAIQLATAAGYRDVQIYSGPSMTTAHALYLRFGFVRRLERETGIVDSGQRLHVYTYRIPPDNSSARHIVHPPTPHSEDHPKENSVSHIPADNDRSSGRGSKAAQHFPVVQGPIELEEGTRCKLIADQESLRFRASLAVLGLTGLDVPVLAPGESHHCPAVYDDQDRLISDDWRWISRALASLDPTPSLYPNSERAEIDHLLSQIHDDLIIGVERALYDEEEESKLAAFRLVYARLGQLDWHLSSRTYLVGEQLSVADLELVGFLIGLDLEYRGPLKHWGAAVADYPALFDYGRRLIGQGVLTNDQLVAVGALADAEGFYAEPFGSPLEVEGIPDIRAAWAEQRLAGGAS